jgi:hypothetical protein
MSPPLLVRGAIVKFFTKVINDAGKSIATLQFLRGKGGMSKGEKPLLNRKNPFS